MNADVFGGTDYYFQQALKLVVYSYIRLRNAKEKMPYSRVAIHEDIKKIKKRNKSHLELEDYLRNDIVDNYMKSLRAEFGLAFFLISMGTVETRNNVTLGVTDIRFESASATALVGDGPNFIFECKRLNKYAKHMNGYIEKGMMRFIDQQYYANSAIPVAGMIAFVEVDTKKYSKGYVPVSGIAALLSKKISKRKRELNVTEPLNKFPLTDGTYAGISDFEFSYRSKHVRSTDKLSIHIHHLLLDYHQILQQ